MLETRELEAILPAILIITFGLIASITLIPSLEKKTNSSIQFLYKSESLKTNLPRSI